MVSPDCGKPPTLNCVKLEHLYNCPRHTSVYCKDRDGQTCVQCAKKWQREEQEIQNHNRLIQEAVVAEALANRAESIQAKKPQWGSKLPKAEKLAKTAAQKAREVAKTTEVQEDQGGRIEKARKGAKGATLAKLQGLGENHVSKAEPGKTKGKKGLRIQRGQ